MMTTTAAPAPIIERHHVSWETYNFMRQEIARLQAEVAQLRQSPGKRSSLMPARSRHTCRASPRRSPVLSRSWKQISKGRSRRGCATSPVTACCASNAS